jgi:hypothetical protein
MVEISSGIAMQILVSAVEIVAMVATAALMTWYKDVEETEYGPHQTTRNADLSGGDA